MAEYSYYTQEGLDKLRAELHELKTRGRADIAQQIAEARDKGDLSENAEYDAAKDAQGMLEHRIAKLEEELSNARLLDESKIDASRITVMSRVKIRSQANGKEMVYVLVSEKEADLKSGKISVKSPIGVGLLGKSVGDVAEVNTPRGKMKFDVLEVARA